MPPKQADSTAQRTSDALYLFESLFHVADPITINVSDISAQTGAKSNTIAKRISILRLRYPGLNIQTTAVPSRTSDAGPSIPATPAPRRGRAAAKATPRITDPDTTADIADDERTPVKPANTKRKRATSSLGSASKPKAKRGRPAAASRKASSEDELALSKDEEGTNKGGEVLDGEEEEGMQVAAEVYPRLEKAETVADQTPLVVTRSQPAPKTLPLSQKSENQEEALQSSPTSSLTLSLARFNHAPSLTPQADNYMSYQTPAQTPILTPCDQPQHEPEQNLHRDDIIINQTTLLRRIDGGRPKHRIVGIDIGFDDIFRGGRANAADSRKESASQETATQQEDDHTLEGLPQAEDDEIHKDVEHKEANKEHEWLEFIVDSPN